MASRRLQVVLDLDTGRYSGRMNDAASKTRAFAGVVNSSSTSVRQMGRSFNNLNSSMSTPLQKLRDYVLILGNIRLAILNVRDIAVGWVGSMLQQSAQVERLTILMKGLSSASTDMGRSQEASNNLRTLFQMARKTGFAIDVLADSFVKLKSGGIDPMDGSLNSIADAVAHFGGTSDVMHRASIAIQQMAGKGVISMEELRQQLGEAVPTAMNDMARAAGMALPEFTKLVSKGVVQAQPALQLMFQEFERLYSGAGERLAGTLTGQLAQFETNVMDLATFFTGLAGETSAEWQNYIAIQEQLLQKGVITIQQFDELTKGNGGLFAGAKSALQEVNAAMQSNEGRQFAADIGVAVNNIMQGLISVGGFLVRFRSQIGIALTAFLTGFALIKSANILQWLWSSIGVGITSLTGLGATSTAATTAVNTGFAGLSQTMTNYANKTRQAIALQNGRIQVIQREVVATHALTQAARNNLASMQSQQVAMQQKVIAERANIAAARQAQVIAQSNISLNRNMSVSVQNLRAAKSAETLATLRLADAERVLALSKTGSTRATQVLTAAVTAETAAVGRATVAKGAATTAQRLWSAAAIAGAGAATLFGRAMSLLLGPVGLVVMVLLSAAHAAGVFESKADRATAAAARLRSGMADLADVADVQAGIASKSAEVSKIDDILENGIKNGNGDRVGITSSQREFFKKKKADLVASISQDSRDVAFGRRQIRIQNAGAATSNIQSQYSEVQSRNSQDERAKLAKLEQDRRSNKISQGQFQSQADKLKETTNAKNLTFLDNKIADMQKRRDVRANKGEDVRTHDLVIKDLSDQRDAAKAATAQTDTLRGSLVGAGEAGKEAGKKTSNGLSDAEKASKKAATEAENLKEKFDNMIGNQAGEIAELSAGLYEVNDAGEKAGTQLAGFKARVKAGMFDGATKEQLEQLEKNFREIDRLTSERDWGRSLRSLRKEVSQTTEAANGMWRALQADNTGKAFEDYNRADGVRTKFAPQIEQAGGDPVKLAEVNAQIAKIVAGLDAIDAANAADGWREMTDEILISLMSEEEARQANFDREVERQERLLSLAEVGTERRILMEQRFAAWRLAAQTRMERENESQTTKMARDWARLGQNIDGALAGALGRFADGLLDAKFNFVDFAGSIIKELVKIILKAMIAYAIMSALGLANNSSGGKVGFGDFMKGQIGQGFGGGSNPNTQIGFKAGATGSSGAGIGQIVNTGAAFPVGHIGGIIGSLSQSAIVDTAVFAAAKRYHSGTNSIGGRPLRPGEVPMIGMEGEAVLTEEHQSMISRRLKQGPGGVPAVTVNVINNSSQQLEADQGDPQFDGTDMIINVVVEAAQKEGPLRDVLSGMSK